MVSWVHGWELGHSLARSLLTVSQGGHQRVSEAVSLSGTHVFPKLLWLFTGLSFLHLWMEAPLFAGCSQGQPLSMPWDPLEFLVTWPSHNMAVSFFLSSLLRWNQIYNDSPFTFARNSIQVLTQGIVHECDSLGALWQRGHLRVCP